VTAPQRHGEWSITRRLSVAFALASLLLMSTVGVFLSVALEQQLEEEHLIFLTNDVAMIRARLAAAGDEIPLTDNQPLKQSIVPVGSRLRIAIFAGEKNLLAPAPWLDIRLSDLPAAADKGERLDTSMTWRAADGKYYRLVTAWAGVGGGADKAMIALALDVSLEQRLLAGYRNTLIITLLLAVLGAALIGHVVSRQGLAPIRRIAAAANAITSSQLDRKLDASDAPTELYELIVAFNRMLDRLRESFDRLSQFSSDLAHELRTPINNLLGEAQVALSRPRSAEDYRAVLESGVEEFERLSKMIENMLFLARADGAESVIAPQRLDALAELEKVAEFYQLVADDSGVRIECTGAATVWADPLLLRRAINNLLSNALRYTADGAVILLETAVNADGTVTIAVKNPGTGIAAAHRSRIFDRFYRADAARERSVEGAGLGLAIVRTIMQLHGGSVGVTSEAGGLTTFTLMFPAAPRDTV
jgi:two-component system heavy metal sensor histidine kinase CusS